MKFLSTVTLTTLALSAFAKSDLVIDGASGFAAVRGASHAACSKTPEALVLTDIEYDLNLFLETEPIYPGNVESFEFTYRVTGETSRPKAGGELFYSYLGSAFSDGRKWRLPPLVRDGQWHVLSVPLTALVDQDDWLNCGAMSAFRFDPTNAEGGKMEIKEIRFRTHASAARVKVKKETYMGEEKWPDVQPEVFALEAGKAPKIDPVGVEYSGGTVSPRQQTAGGKVTLRYAYRGEVPKTATVSGMVSILRGDNALAWSERMTLTLAETLKTVGGDAWALEFAYDLPLYIGTGDYEIRFETPSLRATRGAATPARVKVKRIAQDPRWTTPLRSEVVTAGGTPQFAVNGEPIYALWGTVAYGRHADRSPARHSSAPMNVATVWTKCHKWWPKGDEFDPIDLDRVAEQHRRAYPDAYFMWDISIYPPSDWSEANKDEMTLDEQGVVNHDGGIMRNNFSFASQKVYVDLERVMRKVIAYLEKSPYANRIIGYRVNSGHTVEWLGWDPTRKNTILDFSPVAQKGFEAFAKEHYPWVTDYSVPTLAERRALDGTDILWDQRKHARTIAYHDFYSTIVADGAIRMCRAAKEALGGKKLVGTYYGYVMTLNAGGCNQMRAHYAMKHFLDAGAVDFVMSPQNYPANSRQPGTLVVDMKPFASIQAHGMVPVIEDDTRTHQLCRAPLMQTLNEEMTVNVMRRNMGVSLCRNQPFYTYAITSGNEFDFPQFAEDAAVLASAGRHGLATGTRRNAEIAYVVSEEAIKSTPMLLKNGESYIGQSLQVYGNDGKVKLYDNVGGPKVASWVYSNAYTEMGRIGAAVDYVLAEDLADNPGDYKMYVFSACTKLTPALLKAAESLRKRNCTVVWTYAPGYAANEGNSVENMKALTGMEFRRCTDVTDPSVTLEDGSVVGQTRPLPGVAPLSPIFAAVKPDLVLGRYSNGEAGLAVSTVGQARTYFSGSHFVKAGLMRKIAREAGVHLFSDTLDILEANERFVVLHARNSGKKTIRLPRKTSVVDVFNRTLMAKDVASVEFEMEMHETRLLYYADDAESLLKDL